MKSHISVFEKGYSFTIYTPDIEKRWYVQYDDNEGNRRRRYSGLSSFSTHKSRLQAAKKLIKEIAITLPPPVTDLEKKIQKHFELHENIWGISAKQSKTTTCKRFVEFLNGRKLTRELVEAFFLELRGKRHETTYNGYRYDLSSVFEAIGIFGMFENVPKLKAIKTPARYFQKYQAAQLTEYMQKHDPELLRFIQFMFYCFIRPNEIRQLKAGDVLMDEAMILVRGSVAKNDRSEYVSIPDAFMPSLQWVYEKGPGEWLFPSRYNNGEKHIGKNTMSGRHRDMLRTLKYGSDYKMYSWKHTGAVMGVKAGLHIKELQLQLRHHSLDQTDQYLRQLGVGDFKSLRKKFPALPTKKPLQLNGEAYYENT